MRKKISLSLLWLFVFVLAATAQSNQNNCVGKSLSEGFPQANFYGEFRKHDALPFFSWQGRLGLDANLYEHCRSDVRFRVDFQTVGAETVSNKVNLAGTSYIVEPSYHFSLGDQADYLGFGFTHLSSHVAEDLVKLTQEESAKKHPRPEVVATDLNVIYMEVLRELKFWPFDPRIRLRIQPVGFRFRGGGYFYDQPVYLKNQLTLWQGKKKSLNFETTHEWGKRSLNTLSFKLNLFEHTQSEGRLQFFGTWTGGDRKIFVGPNEGWNHGGWSAGTRVIFQGN